ncbi:MAG: hypothetical protein WD317_04125 [Balneolaceae bacterium]
MKNKYSVPAHVLPALLTAFLFLITSCSAPEASPESESLTATGYNSGFEQAGSTWNSLSAASDGKIYYSFSTTDIDQGAQFFSFDPETENTEMLADLTEVTDGIEVPAIPQGKSHGNFYEMDGKLYISTHVGVHGSVQDGEVALEREGYEPYPGGHFLSYDLSTGEFEELALAPENEGILSMTMDRERGHIYGITWPRGHFIHYDVEADELKDLGLISGRGEAGTPGDDFRVLCRSLFVDPADGTVYFSTADGDIFSYNPSSESVNLVEGVDLRLDYFGEQDPTRPGSMGYGWRQIVWHPSSEAAYGTHGDTGYLFRFDPREPSVEIVERIVSEPSRKSGMADQHYYGYLGFELGPDGETLYFLTGGPYEVDGQRVTNDNAEELGYPGETENLHLVTYNIPNEEYIDHGPIFDSNGSRVTHTHAITVDGNGSVYLLGQLDRNGEREMDLIRIQDPLAN